MPRKKQTPRKFAQCGRSVERRQGMIAAAVRALLEAGTSSRNIPTRISVTTPGQRTCLAALLGRVPSGRAD